MFYSEELTEYLNSIQQRLMEEKIELDRAYADICNHILENEKFASLLDESNDPNYESFTPRDVNAKNKEKINILIQEKKELENEGTSIKAKIEDIIFEQDKLNEIIQKNREAFYLEKHGESEQESLISIMSRIDKYHTETKESQQNSIAEKINASIHRVELCTHIFSVDKMRCKMELDNLKNELMNLQESIDTDIHQSELSLSGYLDELSERVQEQYPHIHISMSDDQMMEELEKDIDKNKKNLIQSIINSYFYEKLEKCKEHTTEYGFYITIESKDNGIRITIKMDENIDFSMIL